jgi:hypothetical protein
MFSGIDMAAESGKATEGRGEARTVSPGERALDRSRVYTKPSSSRICAS